ncbi:hypothetical protein [Actinoplanes sp. RD1]|uniref:hypothetical protein n=1 Tax=Actinoplanes sp. RD1 TaxID=3064538 RepID=UPI0027416652|nr:hypothetical protein [Actinoplanes sp. RD1]
MRHYAKPVVIADDLEALQGKTSGTVTLPHHLQWSGNPVYDLDQPGELMELYRVVIGEAMSPADLHAYLDREMLVTLWSAMWLPRDRREAWEARFPELAAQHRASAA